MFCSRTERSEDASSFRFEMPGTGEQPLPFQAFGGNQNIRYFCDRAPRAPRWDSLPKKMWHTVHEGMHAHNPHKLDF